MNWQSSKVKLPDLQARDQPRQSDLGGVGRPAEHTFAEKGAAELHPVEPADQRAVAPHFDRVRVARAVQREHRLLELGIDPGLLAIGASGDDGRRNRGRG